MLTASIRTASFVLAAGGLALAAPASAVPMTQSQAYAETAPVYGETKYNQYRDRWDRRDRYDNRYGQRYQAQRYQAQRYNDNYRGPTWRGNDGRTYCRKSDGTTGLIIGGAAGALLGREIAGRGDRTLGTILGAAGGALLGKSIDSKVRCN